MQIFLHNFRTKNIRSCEILNINLIRSSYWLTDLLLMHLLSLSKLNEESHPMKKQKSALGLKCPVLFYECTVANFFFSGIVKLWGPSRCMPMLTQTDSIQFHRHRFLEIFIITFQSKQIFGNTFSSHQEK